MLDKIYTSRADYYGTPVIHPPIGLSDHKVVIVTPNLACNYVSAVMQKSLTRRTIASDKVTFAETLHAIPWEELYQLQSCEEQLTLLTATIKDLTDSYFLEWLVIRCARYTPWVTNEFRNLVSGVGIFAY